MSRLIASSVIPRLDRGIQGWNHRATGHQKKIFVLTIPLQDSLDTAVKPRYNRHSMNHLSKLHDYGYLFIEGQEVFKFLQGQLTCDMNLLTPEHSLWGSHCNPKGRMISLFRVFSYEGGVILRMPKPLAPIAEQALKKYSLFFKVHLTLVTSMQTVGFSGDTIQMVLKKSIERIPEAINQTTLLKDLLLLRVPGVPPRFELLGPTEKIIPIQETLSTQLQPISTNDWKYQELGYEIPNLYPKTSECFLPQMLNLDALGGISFKKGCYTGQEVIARSHYRGSIKRHLHLFEEEHFVHLKPGDKYQQGIVVDAVTHSNGATRTLAVVPDIV